MPRLCKASLLYLAILWACLFCPSRWLSFCNGLPIDHLLDFVIGIALFAMIFTFSSVMTRGRLWWILLVLALTGGMFRWIGFGMGERYGLKAIYNYEARPGSFQMMKSVLSSSGDVSKIDDFLEFDGINEGFGRRPLWLDFLNSTVDEYFEKLNRKLEITWTAVITPDQDCELEVHSNGKTRLDTPESLQKGNSYPFELHVSFETLSSPSLRLSTKQTKKTVPYTWFTLFNPDRFRKNVSRIGEGASYGCFFVFFALAIGAIGSRNRSRPELRFLGYGLVLAVSLAHGTFLWEYKASTVPDLRVLPPHDYLIYESEARNFLQNGFHDDPYPFHRSVLMRYYLALGHVLFGEGAYGIVLFQQLLIGFAALLIRTMWMRLGKNGVIGWILVGIVLFLPQGTKLSLRYWSEIPALPLFALLCLCLTIHEQNSGQNTRWVVAGGIVAGTLALMRTNAIFFLPTIPLWMILRRYRGRHIVAFLLPFLLLLSFVPIRNRIVVGRFIFTTTQGPLNAILGNNIPKDIRIPEVSTGCPEKDKKFYEGVRRLLDFENNPDSTYDPFPGEENEIMQKPLTKVFVAYLSQRPDHFIGQVFKKTHTFFFPLKYSRIILVFTSAMLLSIFFLYREKKLTEWSTLLVLIFLYALPLLITHWEARHRLVCLPEIALVGGYLLLKLHHFFEAKGCYTSIHSFYREKQIVLKLLLAQKLRGCFFLKEKNSCNVFIFSQAKPDNTVVC